MNEWIQLTGGGLLLYFGAEWFVGGASALALALRVPQILVGLTAQIHALVDGCLVDRCSAARTASAIAHARDDATAAGAAADAAGAPNPLGIPRAAATAGVGLVVLLVGGSLFIDGTPPGRPRSRARAPSGPRIPLACRAVRTLPPHPDAP